MKKGLVYFIFIMAIILAATVAYVSISGLLTVFSGAGFLGLIFFLTIEISKIVATSAIHTYGKKIGWVYNTLLSLGILIAMGITSMGVYGFLSSGYEKNSAKDDNINRKISLLDNQIKLKEKSRESINLQITQNQQSINQLRTALGNNTQSRVDKNGNVITTSSAGNRKAYESQLKIALESEQTLNKELSSIDSVVTALSETKIKIESDAAMTNELGPLKYLAEVTGTSMDNVMKWFILLLIVIGDPMAILMIIIFNKIINSKDNNGVEDNEKTENESPITDEIVNQYMPIIDKVDTILPVQPITSSDVIEVLPTVDVIDEEKPQERKITLDDLPERNNRGFSVNIPERKQNNTVERIGSNKEVRDGDSSRVFFKKR